MSPAGICVRSAARPRLAATLGALVALWAGAAEAFEGIGQIGYGPQSQAMAGAGVAADTGVGGLLNNPATMALARHNALEIGFDVISPTFDAVSQGGLGRSRGRIPGNNGKIVGSNRNPYVAPQFGIVKKLNHRVVLGFAVYSKGGAGSEWGDKSIFSIDATGQQTGKEVGARLLGLDIPLGLAWRVNKRLNLGASVNLVWTGTNMLWQVNGDQLAAFQSAGNLRISNKQGLANAVNGVIAGSGSLYFSGHKQDFVNGEMAAYGLGGRIGLTYQLTPATRLGAAYTFKTRLSDLKGQATTEGLLPGGAVAVTLNGDVKIDDFQWPAVLQVGLAHQITPRWSVRFDTRYAMWADVMKQLKVRFRETSDSVGNAFVGETIDLDVPQDWHNTLAFALGLQYQRDPWVLRAGISRIENPVPSRNVLPVLPTVFEQHATLGIGYRFNNRQSVNFSYAYISMDSVTNTSLPTASARGQATPGFKFAMHVHKYALAYRYQF